MWMAGMPKVITEAYHWSSLVTELFDTMIGVAAHVYHGNDKRDTGEITELERNAVVDRGRHRASEGSV